MAINLASNLFSGLNDPKRNAALQEEFTRIDNNKYIHNKDFVKYAYICEYYNVDPLEKYIKEIFKSKNINNILVDKVVKYCKKYGLYYRCFDNPIYINTLCRGYHSIKNIFHFLSMKMGLPYGFIKDICKISANINNVNIGKGEILMALCVKDMNLCCSGDCGDLYISKKKSDNEKDYLFIFEVKADKASIKAYQIKDFKVPVHYWKDTLGLNIIDKYINNAKNPIPVYVGKNGEEYALHYKDNFYRFINDSYNEKADQMSLEEFLSIIIAGIFLQNNFDLENEETIKKIKIICDFIIKNIYNNKTELTQDEALYLYELISLYILFIMENLHMFTYIDSDTGQFLYIKNPKDTNQLLYYISTYFSKIIPGALPSYENRMQGMHLGGFVYDKVSNKRGRPKKSN